MLKTVLSVAVVSYCLQYIGCDISDVYSVISKSFSSHMYIYILLLGAVYKLYYLLIYLKSIFLTS